MIESAEDKRFEQLIQKFEPESQLLRIWKLEGGVSAQVMALEIKRPDGRKQKMVVRRHGERDLSFNPQIAADEFKLLQILQSVGLPAPKPYYLDQSCEIFSTPYIVIEYIEGKTEFEIIAIPDLILKLAQQLSDIHQADYSKINLSFLLQQEDLYAQKIMSRPEKVDESLNEGEIRDVLEAIWPPPRRNPSVLNHGDFWPGNILWQDGRIAGVIDWEDAALGDPLEDLAVSRMEINWAFGLEAMQEFTRYYQAIAPIDFTNLPYWDLCVALRPAFRIAEWAGDETTEKHMREGHKLFITQAFEHIDRQRGT